jgi:hypothetical protein
VRQLQELTAPLNEGLKSLYPRTQIDIMSDKMTRNLLRTYVHLGLRHDIIFRWQRCTLVAPFSRPGSVTLRMSRSVELFSDGVFKLHLWVHVGPEKAMGGAFFDWQPDDLSAPVGTVELEKMIQDGIGRLSESLEQGVEAFVDHLPAEEGTG